MQLLNLPLETFRAILEDVVCDVEYPELIELRLVNKFFAQEVINAVCSVEHSKDAQCLTSFSPYVLQRIILARSSADDPDLVKVLRDVADRVMNYFNVDPAGGNGNINQRQEITLTIARAALELEDWECSYNKNSTAPEHLLSAAANLDYLPFVKQLVEQEGVDVEAKSDVFGSAFLNAARKGHVEVVRFFLSKGVGWEGGDELNPGIQKRNRTLMTVIPSFGRFRWNFLFIYSGNQRPILLSNSLHWADMKGLRGYCSLSPVPENKGHRITISGQSPWLL